jgi:hypothetical protein
MPAATATPEERERWWKVMRYEAEALTIALQLGAPQGPLNNMITEQRVLYTRILCGFCTPQRDTDLSAAHLYADYDKTAEYDTLKRVIAEAKNTYENQTVMVDLPNGKREPRNARTVFNIMLAHATEERGEGFDYSAFIDLLKPKLKAVTDAIKSLEQKHGRDFPTIP